MLYGQNASSYLDSQRWSLPWTSISCARLIGSCDYWGSLVKMAWRNLFVFVGAACDGLFGPCAQRNELIPEAQGRMQQNAYKVSVDRFLRVAYPRGTHTLGFGLSPLPHVIFLQATYVSFLVFPEGSSMMFLSLWVALPSQECPLKTPPSQPATPPPPNRSHPSA